MREILFRGRRLDNGEWVYGDLLHGDQAVNEHKAYIQHGSPVEVDPATVGQYTGLTDKNGTMIFEGDVIAIHGNGFGYVMWHYNGYFFLNDRFDEYMRNMAPIGDFLELRYAQTKGAIDYRIIGNIHDTKLEEMK